MMLARAWACRSRGTSLASTTSCEALPVILEMRILIIWAMRWASRLSAARQARALRLAMCSGETIRERVYEALTRLDSDLGREEP